MLCKRLWTLWSSRQEPGRLEYPVGGVPLRLEYPVGGVPLRLEYPVGGVLLRLEYQLIHGEMLLYIV